jgi:2-oxoglutarate ferredoxin oxidoreductase subunit alpha
VFIVEQNRDSQMRTLLTNEFDLSQEQITAVPYVDGTPIDARFICKSIRDNLTAGPYARDTGGTP